MHYATDFIRRPPISINVGRPRDSEDDPKSIYKINDCSKPEYIVNIYIMIIYLTTCDELMTLVVMKTLKSYGESTDPVNKYGKLWATGRGRSWWRREDKSKRGTYR